MVQGLFVLVCFAPGAPRGLTLVRRGPPEPHATRSGGGQTWRRVLGLVARMEFICLRFREGEGADWRRVLGF